MSHPYLLPELFDHVVDFLHDSSGTLENCCLVSKSWIPRTRKYLFAEINFRYTEDLESWEAMFPDTSTSPACYTKTLFIGSSQVIAAAGTGQGGWLSAFSQVVHFKLRMNIDRSKQTSVSLVPFHGFWPALKSLSVINSVLSCSRIFNLIHSFPLLENLSVFTTADSTSTGGRDHGSNEQPTVIQPSSSPVFTGSLELFAHVGVGPFVSLLLSLPNGLHFRNLGLTWYRTADVLSSTALVEGCCSTLESLKIDGALLDSARAGHVDLNKATRLTDVAFTCWLRPTWILTALQTITRDHRELKRITLAVLSPQGFNDHESVKNVVGENQGWLELDRLLAQLGESHSIGVKVLYNIRTDANGGRERSRMGILLPEVTTRGIVELVGEDRG